MRSLIQIANSPIVQARLEPVVLRVGRHLGGEGFGAGAAAQDAQERHRQQEQPEHERVEERPGARAARSARRTADDRERHEEQQQRRDDGRDPRPRFRLLHVDLGALERGLVLHGANLQGAQRRHQIQQHSTQTGGAHVVV